MAEAISQGVEMSNYKLQAKVRGKNNTATMLYFGAWTCNNLPLLFECEIIDGSAEVNCVLKMAVP